MSEDVSIPKRKLAVWQEILLDIESPKVTYDTPKNMADEALNVCKTKAAKLRTSIEDVINGRD